MFLRRARRRIFIHANKLIPYLHTCRHANKLLCATRGATPPTASCVPVAGARRVATLSWMEAATTGV